MSTEYIPSMGSLEVGLYQREELEHRHIDMMLISVRICRQELQIDRILMKRVARSPTAGLQLPSVVDINISSIKNLWTPVLSGVICTFREGHDIL